MAANFDPISADLTQLSAALKAKQISATELAQVFLTRVQKHTNLNAFLHINEAATLQQAQAADVLLAASSAASESVKIGNFEPLLGIPIGHKDIFVTRDWQTTAGSKMLQNYQSPFDATVVEKLGLNSAGMVTLGKLNCDEFAMGSSNENSAYGAVKNPWDKTRIPGGSSGGSAAAVAAGLVPCATGTDTGGSLRQPAAMCGITAIKPTYGRVSRYGMIAFASSLDQGGPMARSAKDCALLLNALCGFDEKDSTSANVAHEDYAAKINETPSDTNKPLSGLRVGIPLQFWGEKTVATLGSEGAQATNGVLLACWQAIQQLQKLGATLVDVSLPRLSLSVPAYYVIAPAEASSNLSRFDGVRYGHRAENYTDLESMISRTRAQGFGAEVQRRILTGTYVLCHGYYDAYYLQAQRVRRLIAQDFQAALQSCDVLAGPVAPTTAWKIGEKNNDPVAMYLEDIYTLGVSLAGLPALSAPCGFSEGMPVGLQLIANHYKEADLLNVAHQYQTATDWHLRRPEGF
jgi:aspartyl-tRNA(Asn)/glutamyl-tRNA(Gln) amidotransferase subunit A